MAFSLAEDFYNRTSPLGFQFSSKLRRLKMGSLFRWRLQHYYPQKIIAIPQDLRPSTPSLARDFYNGRFPLAGRLVETGGSSPFQIHSPEQKWEEALQGFGWLRHLAGANSELDSAHARALVSDWIQHYGHSLYGIAWQPDLVARRTLSWFYHSDFLLKNASADFVQDFMPTLGRQISFLKTSLPTVPENEKRLFITLALSFSALCVPLPQKTKEQFFTDLATNLEKQILPDGGHISRSPIVLLELLTDLLSLRHVFLSLHKAPPQFLVRAIERMLPALRFFIHRDGHLAHFNGVGAVDQKHIQNIFSWDDTKGKCLSFAPYSGYQRLSFKETTVIADIGKTPLRHLCSHTHAGCLSFEMSSATQRFIINAGLDTLGLAKTRLLGRLTAAHSTATINNTSSCQFKKNAQSCQEPIADGVRNVKLSRIEGPERAGFIASHDGYLKRMNLLHERALTLTKDGKIIEGYDQFTHSSSGHAPSDVETKIAIRFHLHPAIRARKDGSKNAILESPLGEAWLFCSLDSPCDIEESIYFGDNNGPVRTKQLALHIRPALHNRIRWRLLRLISS